MADEKVRMTELPPATEIRDEAIILINQGGVDYKAPAPMILRAENNLNEVDPPQGRASLNVYSREETDERSKLVAKAMPVANIAEGLSKTSNGELFVVPQGAGAESSFIYYRNAGGSATEVARDPGVGAINAVKAKIPVNYENALLFMANNGIIAAITEDGTFRVIEINADILSAATFTTDEITVLRAMIGRNTMEDSGYPFAISAENGYVVIIDDNGTVNAIEVDASVIKLNGKSIEQMFQPITIVNKYPVEPSGVLDGFEHIPHYGQSQVIGTSNGVIHNFEFDTATKMLRGGLRAFNVAGHDPNVTQDQYYNALVNIKDRFGETFIPGQAIKYREFLTANYPTRTVTPVFTLGGQGGSTVVMINKGTEAYTELMRQWAGTIATIKAAGGSYRCEAMVFAQGGSDDAIATAPDVWEAQVTQLRKDINADIKAATGITIDPAYIFPQINNYMRYPALNGKPNIGLKQYDLAVDRDGWFGSSPTYILDFIDVAHWTKESQVKVGAYMDRVYRNIITQGGTWKPLHPVKFTNPGDGYITIKFHMPNGGNLVIDNTIVNPVTAAGFAGVNSAGVSVEPASCTIVSKDTIRLFFTDGTSDIRQITYAQSGQVGDPNATDGSGLGRVNGVRGNLRDNAGDNDTIDISGTAYPLHNWCFMFTHNL